VTIQYEAHTTLKVVIMKCIYITQGLPENWPQYS